LIKDLAADGSCSYATLSPGFTAEVALKAGSNARDDDFVSYVKLREASSDLLDDTNALVTEGASIGDRGEIALRIWR
jgi:hypothetical protein